MELETLGRRGIEDTALAPHPELVSVVIPCYRQARFLGEAIDSVLAQTHPHYEIIVVDDGSPDETAQVAAGYSTVRYVRHERNRGLPAARNTGMHHSRGPYLVFLDADDRILPHHLETCLDVFRRRPELALVCGDFRWFGAEGTWHRHTCSDQPDQYAALLRFGFITPPHTVMVRREALMRLGGFGEHWRSNEDRDCWLRLARLYPIQCHHQVIAEYRRHPNQMSRKWDVMLSTGVRVMRDQWPYVKGNPVYEAAYRSGVRQYQDACGPPLVWQMVADARAGRWGRAFRALWVLLRFYPQGLAGLLRHKLGRLLVAEKAE
ncbi:glycosyltransferase family 2 protein [Candidatus Nitrospira bockiana]